MEAVVVKLFLAASAVFGFLSVAFGAFGAHALKERLDAGALSVFQTGVTYQFYHALALGFIGLLLLVRGDNVALRVSGYLFIAGVFVFSGSLYTLSLSGQKFWGAITPIGGVSFLAGWLLLLRAVLKMP